MSDLSPQSAPKRTLSRSLPPSLFYDHRSGRGGRRFKSCHSDHYLARNQNCLAQQSKWFRQSSANSAGDWRASLPRTSRSFARPPRWHSDLDDRCPRSTCVPRLCFGNTLVVGCKWALTHDETKTRAARLEHQDPGTYWLESSVRPNKCAGRTLGQRWEQCRT
jgi:hypothetical protein